MKQTYHMKMGLHHFKKICILRWHLSLVLCSDSVRKASGPDPHVLFIVVVPNLFVLFLFIRDVVFHYHYFVMSSDISLGNLSVVDMNLTVHLHVVVLETHQVLVVFVSLHWNRTVVVE